MFFMGLPVVDATAPRHIEYGLKLQLVEILLLKMLLERDRTLLVIAFKNDLDREYITDLVEGIEAYGECIARGRAVNDLCIDIIANACEEDGILHELFS